LFIGAVPVWSSGAPLRYRGGGAGAKAAARFSIHGRGYPPMKALTWDKTLSVDVAEIDEDHRRLVDLYNVLSRAVADGDSTEYVEAVTDELIACTVWHFRHEERLMLRHGYPGLPEHKAEHEELIDSVKDLQQKLRDAGDAVSAQQVEFLERWLMEHIYGADMKMGAYLCAAM
jgi:hemerythrin